MWRLNMYYIWEAIMTSTMIPLLYTHIKLRGYAFRCAKFCALLAYPCAECAYPTMAHCWCHNSFGVSVRWARAILIVWQWQWQWQWHMSLSLSLSLTHHLASPRITRVFYCSVETHSGSSKIRGDARWCGWQNVRWCEVSSRNTLNVKQTELFITQQLILRDAVKRNILAVPRIARIEKGAKFGKTALPH